MIDQETMMGIVATEAVEAIAKTAPPPAAAAPPTSTDMALEWYPQADWRLLRFADAVFMAGVERGYRMLAQQIRPILPPEEATTIGNTSPR